MSATKNISTDFYQYGEQDNVSIVTYKEQMIGEFNDAFDSINISEDEQTADTDYVLSVMGKEAGRIIIPTDTFVKDAFYNNETQEITLVVSIGNDSTKEIKFSVKGLVDIYTGDNLTIEVKNNVISLSESIKTQLSDFSQKIDEVENKIPSLEGYATEEWVENKNYLTEHQDISDKADKVDVYTKEETYSKDEIDSKGYLTEHQDISTKADKADVYTKTETYSKDEIDSKGYLTQHQDISGKLDVTAYTPTDLTNYYTKEETYSKKQVDDAIKGVDVSSQLTNYATMQWVEDKNYLTQHQDISGKADKADVYTKAETYSKDEIDSKGYLTEHQDISGKLDITAYTPTDLSNYYTKAETYSKEEIDSKGYLTEHQDISGKLDITAYTPTDLTNYYTKDETYSKEQVDSKGYLTESKYINNIIAGESVSSISLLNAESETPDYKEFYKETAIDFNSQRIEIVMDISNSQRLDDEVFVRIGNDIKNDHTLFMELIVHKINLNKLNFHFVGYGMDKAFIYNNLNYQNLVYFAIERGKITLNDTVIPSEYYSDNFFDLTSLQIGSRVEGVYTNAIYRKMNIISIQDSEGLKLDYTYSNGESKSVTLPLATNLNNGLITNKEKKLLDIIPLKYATKEDIENREKFIANFSTVQIKDVMPILDRDYPFNPNNAIWLYQTHINYNYYKVEVTFDTSTCKNNEEEIFSFGEDISTWGPGTPVLHFYYYKGNKTLKSDYVWGGGNSMYTSQKYKSDNGIFEIVISKNKITVNDVEIDLKNHFELFVSKDVYIGEIIKQNKFCNATFTKLCLAKVDGASGVLVEYDYNHSDETSGNYLLEDATENMSGLMSSTDKRLINQISNDTITNWNSVYNWWTETTSADTDGIINKWGEIVRFLSNIGDTETLSGIVDGINSAISSEVERATISENDINGSLSSEIERSIKKDDALTNSIAEEIRRATSAETDNANSISTIESFFDNGASKSALKLKTAHKMWGNNFDGTQDISGDIVLPKEQRIIIGGATLSWDEERQALKIDGNLILNGEIITNNV